MALIDLRNVTVRLRGGTLGEFLDIKIGEGNITYDEKRGIQYMRDRGHLDTVRLAHDDPIDVKLDCQWIHLTASSGDSVPTPEDVLKHRGLASSWTSSSSDPCEPYAVDIVLLDIPPCAGDDPEMIILPDFRYESIAHDPKAGTLSFSGKCNAIQASVSRGTVQSY